MSREAAKTSDGVCYTVALEQTFPEEDRILTDPIARSFLPRGLRFFYRISRTPVIRDWMIRSLEKDLPGGYSGFLLRKRYIRDYLEREAAHYRQVVNLGAGLDTTGYYGAGSMVEHFFEVDLPENIEKKKRLVKRALGALPPAFTFVPADFNQHALEEELEGCDYSPGEVTLFIAEAVTQYIEEPACLDLLKVLEKAAHGSEMILTYIRGDFIKGDRLMGWEKAHKKYVESGLWRTGFTPEELSRLAKEHSLSVVEDLDYADLAEDTPQVKRRHLMTSGVERIARIRNEKVSEHENLR